MFVPDVDYFTRDMIPPVALDPSLRLFLSLVPRLELFVPLSHRFLLFGEKDIGVDVGCYHEIVMPQHGLYHFQVNAYFAQQRGRAMPQVMKAHMR